MIKGSIDPKKEYYFSCVWFKKSRDQIARYIREVRPKKVKVSINSPNSSVVITDSITGCRLVHPGFYSFSTAEYVEHFYGNFVFDTIEEAWHNYYESLENEIIRTQEICDKKISQYKKYLIKKEGN